MLVGQRATEDDEARGDESVHEVGVRLPARLLLQLPRQVPVRAGTPLDDEEHRHVPIVWRHRGKAHGVLLRSDTYDPPKTGAGLLP